MNTKRKILKQVEAIYKITSPKGDSKSVSLGLCPGSEVSTKPDVIRKITIKNAKQTQFTEPNEPKSRYSKGL